MLQAENRIDPQVLGTRLRAARKATGLTRAEAASAFGAETPTIIAIEEGHTLPEASEIMKFARLYRRPISELVRRRRIQSGSEPQFSTEGLCSPIPRFEYEQIAYKLRILSENYVELEADLEVPEHRAYPPEYPIQGTDIRGIAEAVAESERRRAGLGDGPLGNLRDRLEADHGLRIFSFKMHSKLAGLFLFSEDLGPCVAINSVHPAGRRQWTMAHEYAHFLMHRQRANLTILDESSLNSREEQIAEAFTEHFLMPRSGLERRFDALKGGSERGIAVADLVRLAHVYGVSFQAMSLRLEALRELPHGTWNRLTTRAERSQEVQPVVSSVSEMDIEERFPSRYVCLAVQAYLRAIRSEGQLARLLMTDRINTRLVVERHKRLMHSEVNGQFRAFQIDPNRIMTSK